ncbi:MAG: rhodanese-like domain-containing protein [Flavobacteriales bacterium]|nr:rhodanese-like domain-containing protein [Flavobacteriales bacterium]
MIIELNTDSCIDFLKSTDCIIIDVRSKHEFSQFRLPNALHLDLMDSNWMEKINELDKSQLYLVYCTLGVRSKSAVKLMDQLGFSSIYHLIGGILNYSGKIEELLIA